MLGAPLIPWIWERLTAILLSSKLNRGATELDMEPHFVQLRRQESETSRSIRRRSYKAANSHPPPDDDEDSEEEDQLSGGDEESPISSQPSSLSDIVYQAVNEKSDFLEMCNKSELSSGALGTLEQRELELNSDVVDTKCDLVQRETEPNSYSKTKNCYNKVNNDDDAASEMSENSSTYVRIREERDAEKDAAKGIYVLKEGAVQCQPHHPHKKDAAKGIYVLKDAAVQCQPHHKLDDDQCCTCYGPSDPYDPGWWYCILWDSGLLWNCERERAGDPDRDGSHCFNCGCGWDCEKCSNNCCSECAGCCCECCCKVIVHTCCRCCDFLLQTTSRLRLW